MRQVRWQGLVGNLVAWGCPRSAEQGCIDCASAPHANLATAVSLRSMQCTRRTPWPGRSHLPPSWPASAAAPGAARAGQASGRMMSTDSRVGVPLCRATQPQPPPAAGSCSRTAQGTDCCRTHLLHISDGDSSAHGSQGQPHQPHARAQLHAPHACGRCVDRQHEVVPVGRGTRCAS